MNKQIEKTYKLSVVTIYKENWMTQEDILSAPRNIPGLPSALLFVLYFL